MYNKQTNKEKRSMSKEKYLRLSDRISERREILLFSFDANEHEAKKEKK